MPTSMSKGEGTSDVPPSVELTPLSPSQKERHRAWVVSAQSEKQYTKPCAVIANQG